MSKRFLLITIIAVVVAAGVIVAVVVRPSGQPSPQPTEMPMEETPPASSLPTPETETPPASSPPPPGPSSPPPTQYPAGDSQTPQSPAKAPSDPPSSPPPTQPQPSVESFAVEADDNGLYPSGGNITAQKGSTIRITFNARSSGVYFGGLDFRGPPYFSTPTVLPGGSTTVEFTADQSFSYRSYWPASNVLKATAQITVTN